jgi:hypothetical protein
MQNYGAIRRSVVARGSGGEREERMGTQRIWESGSILYDTVKMDTSW